MNAMGQVLFELVCIGDNKYYRAPFGTLKEAEAQAKQAMNDVGFDYYFINATVCLIVGTKK